MNPFSFYTVTQIVIKKCTSDLTFLYSFIFLHLQNDNWKIKFSLICRLYYCTVAIDYTLHERKLFLQIFIKKYLNSERDCISDTTFNMSHIRKKNKLKYCCDSYFSIFSIIVYRSLILIELC